MADYISREALIKAVEGNPYVTESVKSYVRCTAKNIPSADVVGVVRCRECRYSDTYPAGADNDMPLKCLSIRYGGVYPDWFCEHGQIRKDGADNA